MGAPTVSTLLNQRLMVTLSEPEKYSQSSRQRTLGDGGIYPVNITLIGNTCATRELTNVGPELMSLRQKHSQCWTCGDLKLYQK